LRHLTPVVDPGTEASSYSEAILLTQPSDRADGQWKAPPDLSRTTEETPPMTLYEFTPSRSTRVRWLLEELGV
jgi:hypothetical protein